MATSLDFRVKNGLVVATTATIQSTTSATSTLTGALTVAGGVGIQGDLYLGGDLYGSLAGGATGSLVYQSATGTTAFLSIGLNGYVLQSNGTNPGWVALSGVAAGSATTASNLANGGPGQVPYQSAAGSTQFIATGTAGTVLVSNGTSAPTFNNTLTLAGTADATSTQTGALQVRGGAGIGGNLYVGGTTSTFARTVVVGTSTVVATTGSGYNTGTISSLFVMGAPTGFGTPATATFQRNESGTQTSITSLLGPKFPGVQIIGDSSAAENYPGSLMILTPGAGTATTRGPEIYLISSRASTAQISTGTFSATQLNDQIGRIFFGGDQGTVATTSLRGTGAFISSSASSNWSSTSTEGSITFGTTPFGSTGAVDRVTIGSTGKVSILAIITATSTITGALTVVGGVGIGGDLYVGGTSVLAGVQATNIVASGTLGVTGTTTLRILNATSGTFSGTLGVTGTSVLNGLQATNIVASGTLGVTGTSILAGVQATNIVASGTLGVTGTSILAGVQATNIVASGTLGVTGTSTLGVVNATSGTFSGTLGVTGTTVLAGLTTVINTTSATSTSSGALQVYGGVGIGGSLYVGVSAFVNGAQVLTTATLGNFGVSTITAGTDTAVNTSTGAVTIWSTSTLQSVTNRGSATTNAITVSNSTSATSTTTGALQVYGGVGIGGTLYVGGLIEAVSSSSSSSPLLRFTNSSSIGAQSGGAVVFKKAQTYSTIVDGIAIGSVSVSNHNDSLTGGLFIYKNGIGTDIGLNLGSANSTSSAVLLARPTYVVIQTSTQSVSTSSGALQVVGGVGVGGNIVIGGNSTVTNNQVILGTTTATSTTTGALQVVGGVGIGGTLYVGNLRADATTSATTWGVYYNPTTKELTTATAGSTSASGTGTTSTFVINNSTAATSTNTGALQVVNGGAGIGGSLYAGNIYSNGSQVIPFKMQEFTAAASTTTFTVTGGYVVGTVMVFANGIFLNSGDFTASNGTTIVLNEARSIGDIVKVIAGGTSSAVNQSQSFSIAMSVAMSM